MFLSVCIELLFADEGRSFSQRIRAAAAACVPTVEFWGWRTKDIDALAAALRSTGVGVTSFMADPPAHLVDRATHDMFLLALPDSCALANELGSRTLIVLSGDRLPGVADADQRNSLIDVLGRAADVAARYDLTLVLEPLNTLVDHPGYFLDATDKALAIVREVSSPHLRLLYDVYHSATMGEDVLAVVDQAGPFIGHVHVADSPGRHEPGTGRIDWPRTLEAIARCGYDGPVGLEYEPTGDSVESLKVILQALGDQGRPMRAIPSQPPPRPRRGLSGEHRA